MKRRAAQRGSGATFARGLVTPAWTEQAACTSLPPERMADFFPEKGDDIYAKTHAARRVCRTCPVRRECLEYGDEVSPAEGTYGGLTAAERRARRAQNRSAA